jgi:hypothetical protein
VIAANAPATANTVRHDHRLRRNHRRNGTRAVDAGARLDPSRRPGPI